MNLNRVIPLISLSLVVGACLPFERVDSVELKTGLDSELSKNSLIAVDSAPQTATLFSEDFESGTDSWNLDSNWVVVSEGTDHVLEGTGHAWASHIGSQHWGDYTYNLNVKMLAGAVQIMFRMSDDRGRYILGLHPGGMYLRRETPWGKISPDLATNGTPFTYGTWYNLSIDVDVGEIRISVGGAQRLYFRDSFGTALWQGGIGLEVVGSGSPQARFDDISVIGTSAPELDWVKTGGPIGGLGYDVRYALPAARVLYVTDNFSGVNKSQDGGETWFATNWGITGRFGHSGDAVPVFTLTVDPNNPDIVWAGLKDAKGLYKSTNGGQLWQDVTPDITEAQFVFRGITIMEGNSNLVYAAGELPTGNKGVEFDLVKGRIYRSENGGVSWEMIWEGENLVRYVIIHPEDPDTLFASLGIFDREANDSDCFQTPPDQGTGGVLKLEKVATGWDYFYLDSSYGLTDHYVGSLVMHPDDPDIMLAGAGNNACSHYTLGEVNFNTGGVFITRNGGDRWVKTHSNEIITSVEFSPSEPDVAYAGGQNRFYVSHNGGYDWDLVAGGAPPWGPPGVEAGFPIDILVDPVESDVLFVNNYGGGNVKSEDGGENWTLASDGYTGALMIGVAVDPKNPRIVYGAARSGAFRSLDGGGSWTGLSYPPASLPTAYAVAVNPENPSILLASHELLGYLFFSIDRGQSWSVAYQIPGIDPFQDIHRHGFRRIVFADPPNAHIVYAGSCRGNVALVAGQTASKGVFKSSDGGVSWGPANDSKVVDKCITGLAIQPGESQTVYAASPAAGLYKTENAGGSWTLLSGLPADVRSVAVHPTSPNIVYAGTFAQGVYKSINWGSGWAPMVAGMEPNDSITSIVIDPANPDVVWAASLRSGVYRWNPDENLWTHVNAGLRTRSVTDLAISQDGNLLYAATDGEGVFRLGELPTWELHLPLILK